MSDELNANVVEIQYEDFAKVQLKVATIIEVSEIPKADKLWKLKIDLGTEHRQILAGIKLAYPDPASLFDKQIVVVTNLVPRTMRGEVSHGMLLAASDACGNLSLVTVDKRTVSGSGVR